MCNKFVAINGSMLMFIEQKSLTNENNNTQDICDGGQFTARSLSYLPNNILTPFDYFFQDRCQVRHDDVRPGAAAGEGLQRQREGHGLRGRGRGGHEAGARQVREGGALPACGQVSHEAAGHRW